MSEHASRSDAQEAMRRRVERWLGDLLSWVRGEGSDHHVKWAATQLPLCVAIGALSEEEASGWHARFARAEQVWRAPEEDLFSEEVKGRAAALLDERFDAFARSEPGKREELAELHAALKVLGTVRLLSKEELEAWDERILGAISERGSAPPGPVCPYRAFELERVVPCPSRRLGGLRPTCLELYRDCAILRWHGLLTEEEAGAAVDAQREGREEQALREGERVGAAFELRDDAGTHYRAAGAPSVTSSQRWPTAKLPEGYPVWGASPFVPAPPARARELEARMGDARFTIALD